MSTQTLIHKCSQYQQETIQTPTNSRTDKQISIPLKATYIALSRNKVLMHTVWMNLKNIRPGKSNTKNGVLYDTV